MSTNNPTVEIEDKFYNTSEASDLNEITEKADVTKPDDQLPAQEEETIDKPVEDKTETEELEATDEDKETQYIELDDKEIALDDVRKWRDGHLMQSDYTKKTTEHAQFAEKERGEIALERENLSTASAEVSEMRDKLAVLVAEDDSIDWAELKDIDPEEYIRLKEKADQRKDALAKVKADRETPADDPALIAEEQGKLFAANPDWLDDDKKPTETYQKDAALMNDYAVKAGFSSEEFKHMTRAHYLTTILKAAKYDELQEKGNKIREKRSQVPVVTKPKAKTHTQSKSMADTFYG